jgi:TatA/E family protein of Tat protein translocase
MGNIGSSELLLILILALLLLGPRRLPEVGASVGRMLRKFRQASRELRSEIDVDATLRLDDPDDLPQRSAPPATHARGAPAGTTAAAGENAAGGAGTPPAADGPQTGDAR